MYRYDVNMDPDMVEAALGSSKEDYDDKESPKQNLNYPEYTGNQVKLELEVTLTPEIVSTQSSNPVICTSSNSPSPSITPPVTKVSEL